MGSLHKIGRRVVNRAKPNNCAGGYSLADLDHLNNQDGSILLNLDVGDAQAFRAGIRRVRVLA